MSVGIQDSGHTEESRQGERLGRVERRSGNTPRAAAAGSEGPKGLQVKAGVAQPGWGQRKADSGEAVTERPSQLAGNSHTERKERMTGPFREWEERLYVGDHKPGKTNERLPSLLGSGMESLLYDSISCIFAAAGKAVQGVTMRAQAQPTQDWHMELSPPRRINPYTQSQNSGHSGPD